MLDINGNVLQNKSWVLRIHIFKKNILMVRNSFENNTARIWLHILKDFLIFAIYAKR